MGTDKEYSGLVNALDELEISEGEYEAAELDLYSTEQEAARVVVPKNFSLMGRNIKVDMVDVIYNQDMEPDPTLLGEAVSDLNMIRIVKGLQADTQLAVFWHEAIHLIFAYQGKTEYFHNEDLIEGLSNGIAEVDAARFY